jgi:heme/copper-type cytochrome/quinol oxidase subunit 2
MNILWFLAGMLVMLGVVFLTVVGFLTKLTVKAIDEKKERNQDGKD